VNKPGLSFFQKITLMTSLPGLSGNMGLTKLFSHFLKVRKKE